MSKEKCEYCGNNPVPHFLAWYFESASCLLEGLRQKLFFNSFAKTFARVFSKFDFEIQFVKFCLSVKLLQINTQKKDCKIQRALVLWNEAENRGIEMKELKLFGRSVDCYLAKKGVKELLFSGLPRPKDFFSSNFETIDDKANLKKEFLKNHFPVPQGGSCFTFKQALEIFKKIKKPVIVKPRLGSRGRHSTTFVKNEFELEKAFKIAKQICFWVVVEEQVFGPVYRATVINFQLAGVLKGEAPWVLGDGSSSILKLIEIKNQTLPSSVKPILLSKEMEKFLSRQNLTFETVVKNGEKVFLLSKIGISYGGSSSEDFEICHPDNKQLFVSAAKVLGDPIVGFDFIIPDITHSFKNQVCGFIEANSLPFIQLHHQPLLGKPRNVAKMVWEMVGL